MVALQLRQMQVVDVKMRGLLRIDLAVIRDGLNRNVYRVLIAKLNEVVDLIEDAAEYFDVLVVRLVSRFETDASSVPVHCSQALVFQREALDGIVAKSRPNKHINHFLEYRFLLLVFVLSEELIVRGQLLKKPQNTHFDESMRFRIR